MKADWIDATLLLIGLLSLLALATGYCAIQQTIVKLDQSHAKLWTATLSKEHQVSGQPWKVEVVEPTYEAARRTVQSRLNWNNKCFMVEPVTKNYVDIRHMQITP